MFIHGLGGDAFKTWSNDKNHENSWPYWLGKEFQNIGMWSIGYAASPVKLPRFLSPLLKWWPNLGQSMSLPYRGKQLLDKLQLNGVGQRPILFIGHSLGGLVTKQILRSSRDTVGDAPDRVRLKQVAQNTRGVMFLATPHWGADLASQLDSFREQLGTTINIADLRAHDAHLADLYDWYRNHAPDIGIETVTYFEGRDLGNAVRIVNESSSHPGIGANPIRLDEDHSSIAKPANKGDDVYLAACRFIRDHVLTQTRASAKPFAAPPSALTGAAQSRIPHQLPPAAEQYFGRSAEKAKVIARLREGKNTAIVAPAGLGKTALAAEAVRAVVGNVDAPLATSPYPDGVVFLDLYEVHGNLDRALHSLATALMGEDFMANAQPHDRATSACRGKRILVIIEGGEEADGIGDHGKIADLFSALSPDNRRLLLTRLSTQSAVVDSVSLTEALNETDAAALLDLLTQGRVTAEVRTRVLALLEGHPLAITWAGNLLARGDENPARLAADWATEKLPALSDPEKATRTLEWLFNRSVRGLDATSKQALAAAGLLARAPFPLEVIVAALGNPASEHSCRSALRTLVQRGLLQRSQLASEPDYWQFTHVLGYRFARDETGSDPKIRLALASWLETYVKEMLAQANSQSTESRVPRYLEHIGALLRTDFDQTLWLPLAQKMLYNICERLTELGQLGQVEVALAAVERWLNQISQTVRSPTAWLREKSMVFNKQGDVRQSQGDQAKALKVYQAAVNASKELVALDPSHAVWRYDLNMSFNNIGYVYRQLGDQARALENFEAAMEAIEVSGNGEPLEARWQRNLSISHINIGGVRLAQGDTVRALVDFQAAIDVATALAANDPSNVARQRDLSVCYTKVGEVHRARDDMAGALIAFQAAMDIDREMAANDVANTRAQHDLSISYGRFAQTLEQTSELSQALEYAEKSLEMCERLTVLDRSNATWQNDMEVNRAMVARLRAASG